MLFRDSFAAVRRFNISFGIFPACWKLEWFLWECSEDWVANRSGPIAGNYQRSNRTEQVAFESRSISKTDRLLQLEALRALQDHLVDAVGAVGHPLDGMARRV
jgi:hypothetical protein